MPKSRRAQKIFYLVYAVMLVSGVFLVAQSAVPINGREKNDETRYAETPATATIPAKAASGSSQDEALAVPILVYHIVRPSYPSDSTEVKKLAHTPEIFDAELSYLAAAGYHIVPLAALVSHITRETPLPPHSIVITFDDGWRDQFEYAFPILKKYHATATFFIFTNAIGRHAFISWDNLREMLAAGMTVGAHSRSHPFLTKITDPSKLWDEISGSKVIIEKNLGVPVTAFAYPFGQYNASSTTLVEKAGYTAARGDYVNKKIPQSFSNRYILNALNAPVTLDRFEYAFPAPATTTAR